MATLAYWDTFAGLVPCRVLRVYTVSAEEGRRYPEVREGQQVADIQVTGNRWPYDRFQVFPRVLARKVVPRDKVINMRARTRSPRILPFKWENTTNG